MSVSFVIVRWMLRADAPPPPNRARIAEAEALRTFSNDLVAITGEFLYETALPTRSGNEETWQRTLRVRLNLLRRAMLNYSGTGPELNALMDAADRLSVVLDRPADAGLRQEVRRMVLAAREAVEERIAEWGLGLMLQNRPVMPGF